MARQSFIAGVAIAGLAFGLASALAQGGPRTGAKAPDFSVVDVDGKTQKLSDFAGKTVVLEWTNHECPYVRKHYNSATMQKLQKDMTKDGIVWLTVISSPPGEQGYADATTARNLTKTRDAAPSNVLLDPKGKMGRAYGAQTTPHMYIIDAKSTLVYAGAIDDKPSASSSSLNGAKSYVRQAISELKAGKPVSEASTKSYGCSIKLAPPTT
jgi:peroxiredoxin